MTNDDEEKMHTPKRGEWLSGYIVAGLVWAFAQSFNRNLIDELIILVIAVLAGAFYRVIKSKIKIGSERVKIILTFFILEIISDLLIGIFTSLPQSDILVDLLVLAVCIVMVVLPILIFRNHKKINNIFRRLFVYIMGKSKIILLIVATLICCLVINYFYQNLSSGPVKNSFNRIMNYYLTGDCDKFASSFYVSFSQDFLDKYGDTDWVLDATYQKQSGIADRCRANRSIIDVYIKNISRQKFSNTAFVLAGDVTVNNNGVPHTYPQSFVMKNVNGEWEIDTYCDTNNDPECK